MTVEEAISWADQVKPNAFPRAVKAEWLWRLEGSLALEVFLMDKAELEELDRMRREAEDCELLVDPPYDDIYTLFLAAKIDEANGEYEKYANSSQFYNARRSAFTCWFCQTYDPAQGYRRRSRRPSGRCPERAMTRDLRSLDRPSSRWPRSGQ